MIFQLIAGAMLDVLFFIINLIPTPVFLNISSSGITDIIGYGMWVITPGVFLLVAGNILFWSGVHLSWTVIRFGTHFFIRR